MNLFNRKMPLFCVSNVVVSFICASFLGISYADKTEILDQQPNEVEIAASDTEPASRLGEDNKKSDVVVSQSKIVNRTTSKNVVTKKEVAKSVTYTPAKYSEVTGNAVVEYAKKYLGLRYVSGGNSLTKGTDCSGFTKLIYKEFGVSLSRTVKGQLGNGTYVRKSDLQKGDLVFYGRGNGSASHVGIYIGSGLVIHQSNPKDGVKISSVNMMQYITARRVINSNAIKIVEQKMESEKTSSETNNNEVINQNTDNQSATTGNNNLNSSANNEIGEGDTSNEQVSNSSSNEKAENVSDNSQVKQESQTGEENSRVTSSTETNLQP